MIYINKRFNYDIFITQSNDIIGDINIITENDNITVAIEDAECKNRVYSTQDIENIVKYVFSILS